MIIISSININIVMDDDLEGSKTFLVKFCPSTHRYESHNHPIYKTQT